MVKVIINSEQIKEIINLYCEGKTQKEISKIFLCSQTNISNILRRQKIKCRDKKDVFKNQKYTDINKEFFKEINSEESAYFLGLLYADGCVQIKNNAYTVSLKLKSNDQYIIEKFRDIMSPSSPVKMSKNKNSPNEYSYFRINQKEICEQLISHGCIPNKSLILEFPSTINQELIRHFVRGYSDGDGCITRNKLKNARGTKYDNFVWSITSTKQFCEKIGQILKNKLNINFYQRLCKPKTNNITTTLSVGGNLQSEKILDWIYKDTNIYLPRKYEKYLEFKEYINSK